MQNDWTEKNSIFSNIEAGEIDEEIEKLYYFNNT
jgi:hypothetical protein